MKTSPSAIYTR